MRFRHFDMNLLVALDALLETKSVTRAGERLCIGASATSSALGRLREHFGDELLQPIGRRMELTPLAKTLIEPVRDILLRTQIAVERRPLFDPASQQRHFVLNASDYIGAVLVPHVLRRLQSEAPGITVDILSLSDNVLEHVNRGEVDLVIFPDHYADPQYPRSDLFNENYTCVVWSDNPLVGDSLTYELYLELGHVVSKFGDTRVASFEEWFLSNHGAKRRVEVSVSSFSAVPPLIVGTNRIATVHSRLARLYAQYLPLRIFPPPVEIPALRMVMQWHDYRNDDPFHAWMRQMLKSIAEVECT